MANYPSTLAAFKKQVAEQVAVSIEAHGLSAEMIDANNEATFAVANEWDFVEGKFEDHDSVKYTADKVFEFWKQGQEAWQEIQNRPEAPAPSAPSGVLPVVLGILAALGIGTAIWSANKKPAPPSTHAAG